METLEAKPHILPDGFRVWGLGFRVWLALEVINEGFRKWGYFF